MVKAMLLEPMAGGVGVGLPPGVGVPPGFEPPPELQAAASARAARDSASRRTSRRIGPSRYLHLLILLHRCPEAPTDRIDRGKRRPHRRSSEATDGQLPHGD